MNDNSQLLNYLRAFSANLDQKTIELSKQVDELSYEAKSTTVRMSNTFNSFIQLSTSQFVENRVYDDDERAATAAQNQVASAPPKPVKDFSKEEVEALLVPKYAFAIAAGSHVLGLYISQDTTVDGAHGESMEHNGNDASQLITTNYWNRRPLPFFIGTSQFAEDDFCGLYYEEPEDDGLSVASETILDGFMSEDEVDLGSDDMDAGAKRRKKKKDERLGDMYDMSPDHSDDENGLDYSEELEDEIDANGDLDENGDAFESENGDAILDENGEDVFDESEEDEEHEINSELNADDPRSAFKNTLASMLGGGSAPGVAKKAGKRGKKAKKSAAAADGSDAFEDVQEANGEDNAPKRNIFADEAEEDGALVDADQSDVAADEPAPKKKASFLDDEEEPERDIFAATAPKSRYASVSASLFDEPDSSSGGLFGDEPAKPKRTASTATTKKASSAFLDDDEDSDIVVPVATSSAPKKAAAAAPKAKKGIFDDEEEEDIFAATAPTTSAAKPAKASTAAKAASAAKPAFSFLGEEEDEDFLGAAAARAAKDAEKKAAKKSAPAAAAVEEKPAAPKKSVFDEVEDEIPADSAKKASSVFGDVDDNGPSKPAAEEDDVDDIKAPKPFGGVSVLPKMPTAAGGVKPSDIAKSKPKRSMFDEDESEGALFAPVATTTTKKAAAKSVFDDDDDILGAPIAKKAASTKTEAPAAATTAAPKAAKKAAAKKSIFDDDGDAGDDIFAAISAKSTKPAKASTAAAAVEEKPKAAPKKSAFDDEEDPILKPKPAAKKSVFDDEDDDILGPAKPAANGTKDSKSRINAAKSFWAEGPAEEPAVKAKDPIVTGRDTPVALVDDNSPLASSEPSSKPAAVTKSSEQKGGKIASLAQNLNLDVSAMIPGAKRPKKSADDDEEDWDPEEGEESTPTAKTSARGSETTVMHASPAVHTGATSSDVLVGDKQLLTDPNLTRARPGGKRLPTRRPGAAASSPAASSSPAPSSSSIFDAPAPKKVEPKGVASIFDEPASSPVVAKKTVVEPVVEKPVESKPAESKPKSAASIFDDAAAPKKVESPKPAVAASIFDEPAAAAPKKTEAPKAASSIFEEPAAVVAKPVASKAPTASIFDDTAAVAAPKPAASPKPAPAASIFDEPAAKPSTPATAAAAPKAAASIFDEPVVSKPAAPAAASPSVPKAAASIFDDPVPVAKSKPASSIFDEPAASSSPKPAAAKPAVAASSIFDDPKPASKPANSVASIFD